MKEGKRTLNPKADTGGTLKHASPGRAVFKIDTRGSDERRDQSDRREQLRLAEVRRVPKDRRKRAGWNGSDA